MDRKSLVLKNNFWLSKKVLITGHTGYVGTWLNFLLLQYQADTYGISLKKDQSKIFKLLKFNKRKNFYFNIKNYSKIERIVKKIKPTIIIHLAAQSLVLKSFEEPINTYETNVMGTLNILKIIKKFNFIKTSIFFTTDKVYRNEDKKIKFKENDPLNGDDPYSGSKAASEIIINSFTKSFLKNRNIIILRAGNIVGGGDYNRGRLIPDIIYGFLNKKLVKIRNKRAIRPWQHILDVIFIIKKIIEKTYLKKKFDIFNVGPNKSTFKVFQILNFMERVFKVKKKYLIPSSKEKKFIILNSNKIKKKYNLKNKLTTKEIINRTVEWYKKFHLKKKNIVEILNDDLNFYQSKK